MYAGDKFPLTENKMSLFLFKDVKEKMTENSSRCVLCGNSLDVYVFWRESFIKSNEFVKHILSYTICRDFPKFPGKFF